MQTKTIFGLLAVALVAGGGAYAYGRTQGYQAGMMSASAMEAQSPAGGGEMMQDDSMASTSGDMMNGEATSSAMMHGTEGSMTH